MKSYMKYLPHDKTNLCQPYHEKILRKKWVKFQTKAQKSSKKSIPEDLVTRTEETPG